MVHLWIPLSSHESLKLNVSLCGNYTVQSTCWKCAIWYLCDIYLHICIVFSKFHNIYVPRWRFYLASCWNCPEQQVLTDNPVGSLQQDLLGLVPIAPLEGSLQTPIVTSIQVSKDPIRIGQRTELGLRLRRWSRRLGGLLPNLLLAARSRRRRTGSPQHRNERRWKWKIIISSEIT